MTDRPPPANTGFYFDDETLENILYDEPGTGAGPSPAGLFASTEPFVSTILHAFGRGETDEGLHGMAELLARGEAVRVSNLIRFTALGESLIPGGRGPVGRSRRRPPRALREEAVSIHGRPWERLAAAQGVDPVGADRGASREPGNGHPLRPAGGGGVPRHPNEALERRSGISCASGGHQERKPMTTRWKPPESRFTRVFAQSGKSTPFPSQLLLLNLRKSTQVARHPAQPGVSIREVTSCPAWHDFCSFPRQAGDYLLSGKRGGTWP